MSNTLAKKVLAVGSTSALLLSSFAFTASAAVHAAGTNVSSNGTVYFIDNTGMLRPYTSAGAFLSYGFNSWASVVPASAEDLALPRGAFVPPMDGSLINDKGTIYVISGGQRLGLTTMAVFNGLGLKLSNVMVGDTSFMPSGAILSSSSVAHPAGALVNDNGTVYLMSASGKMGIPSLAVFNSWGYSFSKVVPANSYDSATPMSNGIMAARVAGQLNPTSEGSTTIPPVTGSVSVSAASTSPVSSTIAADGTNGQPLVNLAEFAFYGNGTVTNVQLKRVGVSADSTLSNVYLFDGSTRLTDSSSVTSGGNINFSNGSGLFSVNGSKTISVRADIAGNTAGQTVGVQLVSAMTGSTAVSGTPVSGSIHTIATATLASVALTSATDSGDIDPGTDVLAWQGTATVSTRDVLMTRLALRQIGSIQSSDIKNFKLFVDGVQVATAANLDANGYVTFTMSKALTTGARTLKVTADIVGGSNRTVEMSLRGSYDMTVIDTQYGANAAVTGTFPFDSDGFTVSQGSLTVVKASDSPSSNVTVGASDVSVGKWTMTAYGEPIKVETLTVGADIGGSATDANVTLRNVRILVNGVQVGNTTNVAAVDNYASGTSFTTNFVVNPGSPATVEVRADMYDAEGTEEVSTGAVTSTQFALVAGSSNGRRQNSLTTLNVPGAAVPANNLTISSGSISVAKTSNYANQTVVVPQTAYKLGSFVISGNSTEAVNLNTIEVDFTSGGGATFDASDDITNLYVMYGNQQTSVKGTAADSDNTWSINYTLPVNGTLTVDVYGTVGSTVTATDTIRADLTVTGITAQSGTTVYADATSSNSTKDAGFNGQTITAGSGSITATLDASAPDSQLVDDSGSVTTGAWKFAAVNDGYTITDATVTVSNVSAVSQVNLKDGTTVVASKPANTTVTFNGLNIAVAANTNKVLTVELVMAPVGVGAGTSGSAITTAISTATARNSQGTSATVSGFGSPISGNAMYVYKALPTISLASLPSTVLANGTNTISRFSVNTSGTGTIAWKGVRLTVTKTGGAAAGGSGDPVIASPTLWDADTGTQITAAATLVSTDGDAAGADGTADCTEIDTTCTVFLAVGTDADDNVEKQVTGAKTYEVRATVTGNLASGDYIATSIARPSSYAASVAYASVDQDNAGAGTGNETFAWSDVSASAHDTGTTDWTNDALLKNLPTSTQTLTK